MDKKTNNLSTSQLQTRQQNKTNNLLTRQLRICQLKKNTSGGYCGGVPPLPIPNREVKPTCADGTAMQCGRVGSRLLLQSTLKIHFFRVLFLFIYLAGFPQIIPQKVWRFRVWQKLFPKRFGVSAHGESHFLNGLAFPRLAKVVSRMVCNFRAWRKSFPEWFGVSAHSESRFPNSLMLSLYAETFVRSWAVCCSLSLIPYNFFVL